MQNGLYRVEEKNGSKGNQSVAGTTQVVPELEAALLPPSPAINAAQNESAFRERREQRKKAAKSSGRSSSDQRIRAYQ